MHPPNWVVQKLHEIHSGMRLAWKGCARDSTELNTGEYMLLQLFHMADLDTAFSELWNDRGPVYGLPYDFLTHVPVMVSAVTPQDVFGGAIIKALEIMLTPFQKRIYNQRLDLGNALEDRVKDMAGEEGEWLYWQAKNSSHRGPLVSKSDVTEEDKAVLRGERMLDLTDTYMPSKNAGGL